MGVAIAFYFGWEMALCGLVSAFVVVILQFGLAIYLKKRAAEDLKAAEDANRVSLHYYKLNINIT